MVRIYTTSTQNKDFNALIFLHKQVLELSLIGKNINVLRTKQRIHLPTVLSSKEVNHITEQFIDNIYKTIL